MSEAVALALLEVEGKLYLNAAEWPIKVYADRVAVKTFDPRRVTWDGQKLKLWLENGNAVYTLAPDDDGKADIVTLHRLVQSAVGEVPGHPRPEPEPETWSEPAAPEPIVVSTSTLEAIGFQRATPPVDRIITPPPGAGAVTSPFTSDLGPYEGSSLTPNIFAKALADAKGMGVAGYAIPSSNNFHGLMHPTGGNAAGYGNVRYFTSQDTFPVTPYRDLHHLQQEVDTMRAKLVSALEMQHTQYLMESPASAALALESSASRWRTFLTDIGGYLNFVQGICQKLATMSYKNAQGEESRVWLTEPLAAQGRLSEFERSYQSERQPKEVTLKEMMGEMGRAAEMLGGQATSLLGIVAPTPLREKGSAPTPQDASEAEDASVLAEVDALTAMIGEQRYPGEWPVPSTSAAAFVRQEAWKKWAKDEARDTLVGDHSIDVAPGDKVVLGATDGNVQLEIFEVDRGNSTGHSFVAFDRAKDASLASTLDIVENAIAAEKVPDVLYERNWDDPGNGGNGQMGGDDGG
jgi:hypothetical protein